MGGTRVVSTCQQDHVYLPPNSFCRAFPGKQALARRVDGGWWSRPEKADAIRQGEFEEAPKERIVVEISRDV